MDKRSEHIEVNSVKISVLEAQLEELKQRVSVLEQKYHELDAEILVKRKLSEAWLKNTAVLAAVVTTVGALGTAYYFLIDSMASHMMKVIHG